MSRGRRHGGSLFLLAVAAHAACAAARRTNKAASPPFPTAPSSAAPSSSREQPISSINSPAQPHAPDESKRDANLSQHDGAADRASPSCSRLSARAAQRRLVAVCFFGLNRSLRFTIASIRSMLLTPLRDACFAPEIYAHTYSLNATLSTSRSSEAAGLPLGGAAEIRALLEPRAIEVTDQADFLRGWAAAGGSSLPKGSAYEANSTRNLLCALNSLARVTRLWMPRAHLLHAVTYLRPDMRMLEPFDLVALAGVQERELYVPYWACWGGLNDRVAFGRPAAARAYGLRLALVQRFADSHRLHAEKLLHFALDDAGVTPRFMSSQSVRVRATGLVEGRDRGLEPSNPQLGLCTPADKQARCVKGRCRLAPIPGAVRPEPVPERCAHLPEYGAPRRQVLVVLHGGLSDLLDGQRAAGIERAVLAPLRSACVVFSMVASARTDAHPAIAGASDGAKALARAMSQRSGLPLRRVKLSPCEVPTAAEGANSTPFVPSTSRRSGNEGSWMDAPIRELVSQAAGSAHAVVFVALDWNLDARLLDVPALFLAREGEVFVSRSGVILYARASTAMALLVRRTTGGGVLQPPTSRMVDEAFGNATTSTMLSIR